MILAKAIRSLGDSMQVKLPCPNMVIDPRPNNRHGCRFECVYTYGGDGTIVTLIFSGDKFNLIDEQLEFRAYDPATETVPEFYSTSYIYKGVDGERAPKDTTVLIIDPSVKTIKQGAFCNCDRIRKCLMHDGVHTIEKYAFLQCSAMKVIRLSRTLKKIGEAAFYSCTSLEALFLPTSLEEIEKWAFYDCKSIRILPLPPGIQIFQLGDGIVSQCQTLFEVTRLQEYQYKRRKYWNTRRPGRNNHEVHQSLIDFYDKNLPPLHKVCLDTHTNSQTILDCIHIHGLDSVTSLDHDGMTPLHTLTMNPSADKSAIFACFGANMSAAFMKDSRDNTPLDYLMEYHKIEILTSLVAALCQYAHVYGDSQSADFEVSHN